MNKKTDHTSPSTVLFIISLVMFLNPFMASGVGIALPTIGKELNAGAIYLGLIEMTYLLAVSILLLPAGRFSDIYGRRKVFIWGIALFTAATFFLALARGINLFLVIRFIQGLGMALMTSTSMAILTSVIPAEERGKAMGIATASVYLGISAGPTVAGFIITHLGWRWVFVIPVVFQTVAFIITLLKLKGEWADSEGEQFDWHGSILYSVSLCLMIYGILSFKQHNGMAWTALIGLAGFVIFYRIEKNMVHPLLDFKLLSENKIFTYSNIATMINYASSFGVAFLFSIYLQTVRGISPHHTGLILMVQPALQVVFAVIAGKMSDTNSPSIIATSGMALCAVGLAMAAFLQKDSSMYFIILILVFMGLGFGFFSSPNTTVIMSSVRPKEYGIASSMLATMRTTGILTSMTIMTVLLAMFLGDRVVSIETSDSFVITMRTAFILFSVMSIFGIGFSLARVRQGSPQRNTAVTHDENSPDV